MNSLYYSLGDACRQFTTPRCTYLHGINEMPYFELRKYFTDIGLTEEIGKNAQIKS